MEERQERLHGLLAFWGKAQPQDGAAVATHPLLAHCLDVAAVAVLLADQERSACASTYPPREMLGFLVALHDIGKVSRNFQAMAPDHWPAAALGPRPGAVPQGRRHDAVGLHLLSGPLAAEFAELLPRPQGSAHGWTHMARGHLWRAVTGHHGRPPETITPPGAAILCADCLACARDFVAVLRKVFEPQPWARPASERDVAVLGWRLAGLTTLADWIGSRQSWFPYVARDAVADPRVYFDEHALPRAARALSEAGLRSAAAAPFGGVRALFPAVAEPSAIQQWAQTVDLPEGPVLAVVEDLTGSGKTESALTLAHRLIADRRASGLFMALPTMATANAMFGRLAEAYRRLFAAEGGPPSLALAHGRAALDPRFAAALAPGAARDDRPPAGADPADEPAEAQCAAWLGEERRRALLAEVGVGTIDQALLAALPVRHAALRQYGLAGKVLIVDEAHAFDAYMRTELAALLAFHAAQGGSAILLSATLPARLRRHLVQAFTGQPSGADDEDAEAAVAQPYPLATLASASGVSETPCAPRPGLPRTVSVTRLDDAAAAVDRIVAAAAGGAAVAWVRNTVDDAIAAATALRDAGMEPLLFHARFALADRLAIEAEVIRRFGRDGRAPGRRGVLVATQVIEQSLDLDFDLLVSDLAPIDLLIQRAGRLWRHARESRPLPRPDLLVVSPPAVDDPPADWIARPQPGTAAVYRDPALLWRGARALFARGALATPGDMRPLIERAADDTAPDAVPAALAAAAARSFGKALGQAGIAAQNTLKVTEGYRRESGAWDAETRTPTRLEDSPRVTLRLAFRRDGQLVPYAQDPDPARAWSLSEVSIARRRVAACPLPTDIVPAAEAARSTWTRWQRDDRGLLLALAVPRSDGFEIAVETPSGATGHLRYDRHLGLHGDGRSEMSS